MNRVTINGVTVEGPSGCNISVVNGVVTINGKVADQVGVLSGTVHMKVEGDIGLLRLDHGSIAIKGNANSVHAGESVEVSGNVAGAINAGGSVKVTGDAAAVTASGSVSVGGDVKGRVIAGGSVNIHKGSD